MLVVCNGVPPLLVAFSDGEQSIVAESDGGDVRVTVDGEQLTLSRSDAVELRDEIGAALSQREAFVRTACEYRADGTYVVERRGADSTGNSTVFDSFAEARALFEELPASFDADALSTAGVTGSRRHMLVRHFAEHPAFPCTLASRNPLEAEKTGVEAVDR